MKNNDIVRLGQSRYQIANLHQNGIAICVSMEGNHELAVFDVNKLTLETPALTDNTLFVVIPNSHYSARFSTKDATIFSVLCDNVDITDIVNKDVLSAYLQARLNYLNTLEQCQISIRHESYNDNAILRDLTEKATQMAKAVLDKGIALSEIKIWIKARQYNDEIRLYPKIEIDVQNQELQYDMTLGMEINEVHFKSFKKNYHGTQRIDLQKQNADTTLSRIDDIIRGIA